ncbi:lipopolysaccharide biosynthesis protein [Actinomarinicola tropica]|nr:lipopolysaccharide biosynthesis protein [Actinomarinicola tropica]
MIPERVRAAASRLPSLGPKLREVASALSLEIASAASLAVIFPLTIRGLGTDAYGEYTTIYVIAGFALTWVYAGGGAAAVQLVMQRRRLTRSVMVVGRRQVTALAIPCGLVGIALTYAVLGGHLWLAAALLFGSDLLVGGITEVNLALVFAHKGMGSIVRIRLIDPVVRAIGVGLLSVTGNITILNLVLLNMGTRLILLGASILAVRHLLDERSDEEGEPTDRGEMARLSALYSTSMSTNSVQNEGEKFLLATFRPTSEVGEYNAAYRVVSAALIPLQAVYAVATRWFLPPDDRVGGHVRKSLLMTIPSLGFGIACAIGIVVGQPIIRWVLGEEFESAAHITLWLAFVPLLHALAEIPPLGLLGLGENRRRMYLGVGAASAAIVVYLVLIPQLGWKGAVIGTYFSELVTIGGGWWMLVRCQRRNDGASSLA